MTDCPIVFENLRKEYKAFTAVDDLSLEIRRNSFTGLLGPNGAGKSTSLKILTNLIHATSGHVYLNGEDVSADPKKALEGVGTVIETPEFYLYLTPRETFRYAGDILGMTKESISNETEEILEKVRMTEWADKKLGKFSKGMRQRISIGLALMDDPNIIILDEPTSGLDPRGMIEIREILNELKRSGLTLMISTHILKEISEMCTHVTMINQGREIVSGNVSDLVNTVGREGKSVTLDLKTLNPITSEFKSELEAFSGVSALETTSETSVKFKFAGDVETQADIVDMICSHNLRMLYLNETGADIESLYMALTSGQEVNIK